MVVSAGPDSLVYYFTGAGSDGGTQTTQSSSLGNYRSSTEAKRVGILVSTPIPNVEILGASRYNAVEDAGGEGLGTGTIYASGPDTLRYQAPGSATPGAAVTLANGAIGRLLDGEDVSRWVRVRRTSASQLAGAASVEFLEVFNTVFGVGNGTAAGSNRYRAVMLRNDFTAAITDVQVFVRPLVETHVVSSVAQLGGAGAGSITGAADAFCHWPHKGWARIETSGGSLREIVYYSSRTDTTLTVPALGRGRLGTSAAAGAGTDKVWSVPGIRLGVELANPLVNGPVQSIANETTAPNTAAFVGTAWSTAITGATGIQVGTLHYQQQAAIWIHVELPAGVSAIARALNAIGVEYNSDAIDYAETLAGMYRIADSAIARYEIHIGVGAEPDLNDPPDETTATLPYDTTYTIPAGTTVYVAVNYRNAYDLVSQNMATTRLEVDGANEGLTPPPLTPVIISWTPTTGGAFRLRAEYDITMDPFPGDNIRLYFTSNGVDPNTGNLLVTVPIVRGGPMGKAFIDYTTTTFVAGTVGKIRIASYRSSDGRISALSATATAIAETAGPSAPSGSIGQRKNYQQDQS